MPWYVLYDYVEVYAYEEESNEFKLHWRDDFEKFDHNRWHKATGGFDANSSVFHPENVSVKAGNLVLKMEPEPKTPEEASTYVHTVELHKTERTDEPPVEHSTERHHLHKSEHFDREHIRAHRHAHDVQHSDEKFWKAKVELSEEESEDKGAREVSVETQEEAHEEVPEKGSDSDADW